MRAVVLDTETTGLNPHQDRVIEIALVDFDTDEILLHTLLNPERSIPPFITELTKIDDGRVADAPLFAQVAGQVADVIRDAEVIIGQNPMFDRGMVCGEFKRLGSLIAPPPWPTLICTKRMWNIHEPPERRHLVNAYKRFVSKDGFEGAHGALADTRAARLVLHHQMREFGFGRNWAELDPEAKSWWGGTEHVVWKNDRLVLNFGKNKKQLVKDLDVGFWKWITKPDNDFPEHVKELADYMIFVFYARPCTEDDLNIWAMTKEQTL